VSRTTPATLALDRAGVAYTLATYAYDPNADRIGMQASYSGDEAVEGFLSFKERRSPSWVHPDLRIDGRI